MLHWAICDDEAQQVKQITALLHVYLQTHPKLNIQIETFQRGSALLERAEQLHGFDLYILDILMPDLSGIETGRRLRTLEESGKIIYLTNSNDYAADSYDVRAFFYLLKPVDEKKLFAVLDEAVAQLELQQSSALVVHTADGARRMLLDRIRYVERLGRRIRYHCIDGAVDSQTIRVSFRDAVAPLLEDRRFWLCGVSFVLNFQHVIGVNGQTALLDDGQALNLPRSAAADFKKAWGNYWLEKDATWGL